MLCLFSFPQKEVPEGGGRESVRLCRDNDPEALGVCLYWHAQPINLPAVRRYNLAASIMFSLLAEAACLSGRHLSSIPGLLEARRNGHHLARPPRSVHDEVGQKVCSKNGSRKAIEFSRSGSQW